MLNRLLAHLSIITLITLAPDSISAGEVVMHDGIVLRGFIEPEGLLMHVDDGLHRYTVSSKRMATTRRSSFNPDTESFVIRQPLSGRSRSLMIDNLTTIEQMGEFNELGRRSITVIDPKRGRVELPQGITKIGPNQVVLQCLKYLWESHIATKSVSPKILDRVIRSKLDPTNVDHRFRLARFQIAAGWYTQADTELKAIGKEFPDVAAQVQEAQQILEQLKATRRVDELKLRKRAGQHNLAYQLVKSFTPTGASIDDLTTIREILEEYDSAIALVDKIQKQLKQLTGSLDASEQSEKFKLVANEISSSMYMSNLIRLERFVEQADQLENPAEALALAVSGWVAGPAFSEPDPSRAEKIVDARTKVHDYLDAATEQERDGIYGSILSQEFAGIDILAGIVRNLGAQIPTPGIEVIKPFRISVDLGNGPPLYYWVSLPHEYNPYHGYPTILTLHGRVTTPQQQIEWWNSAPGFQASRHGYVVIAPEYVTDPKQGYQYDTRSHYTVLASLIDARRRFSIDSDRVFLSGFAMGGDATWDIGLAHPSIFAGIIPICGTPKLFCEHYWQNGDNLSIYAVDGEKNGDSSERTRRVMNRMFRYGYDAMYVEFQGRGQEPLSDEILDIFNWTSRKTRQKNPTEFSCRSARPLDNEFYFVSVDEFVPAVMMDPRVFDRKKIRPAQIEAKVSEVTNAINVQIRGANQADIWLSPTTIDLSRPVRVQVNGVTRQGRDIKADARILLEDFRLRADKQLLFHAKLSFARI